MKKLVVLTAAAIAFAGAAFADPVEGTWKTQVDDGNYAHIEMTSCGAAICGTIAKTFNETGEYKSANLGKKLVWDMKPSGGGSYASGKIWRPSNNKVYKSKMSMDGNTLFVSGCIGPICKKQTWARVN